MSELPYDLQRTVLIKAKPETVFRFFTDSARWANWWGAGSTIDATPGGRVYIRHPNGVESSGEALEIDPPGRIAFTYGFESGNPIPPGSSRVTIRLEPASGGTRLHLVHEFAETGPRDAHVQGWRFQLALFGNAVANEIHQNAASAVDAWFAAWIIADDAKRKDALGAIVTPGISFRDRYSLLEGLEDVVAHTGASLRFMPGIRMERKDAVRHCQGTVLADWTALNAENKELMSGTNVFVFEPEGKIESATGLAN